MMEFYKHRQIFQSEGILESVTYELDADYRRFHFQPDGSAYVNCFQGIKTLDDWVSRIMPSDQQGYMANLDQADKLIHLLSAYRIRLETVEPLWVLDYSQISKGDDLMTRGVIWIAEGIDEVAQLIKRYVI
ncbi:hypothetical protein [Cerasicoccus fimbriatus]|uniref:hypothetical protein n=1 Tax=Cerasicoccus fimbriatus TaxID=3014554 RepID=UPI0022B30FE2|nr:hypothetical protein [Cerasicoccus sp. TK19100]